MTKRPGVFAAYFAAFIVVSLLIDALVPNPPLPHGAAGTVIAVIVVFSPFLLRARTRSRRDKRER